MADLALSIRGLGKLYRLGLTRTNALGNLKSLGRRVLTPGRWRAAQERRRREEQEKKGASSSNDIIWALHDFTADIKEGEVVGIIGRNGSGKSTLLKILSQITQPTEGEVDVYGRLGSLLEVGTGFHPELTGRENIYLNGILLGMTRGEITKKLDDMVSFAEVEKFIDTPVKRYSSGMYVRLAFAVAAHLETEILILDEVLSVGDQAFQRKCLGKVGEVARSGRTVLVVSHNLAVVHSSCTRGLLLQDGGLIKDGKIHDVVRTYSEMFRQSSGEQRWDVAANAPRFEDGSVRLVSIRAVNDRGRTSPQFDVADDFWVEIEYEVLRQEHVLSVHLYFRNEFGQTIFVSMDNRDTPWSTTPQPVGIHRARCHVPAGLLSDGIIRIEYLICQNPTKIHHVTALDAITITITDAMRPCKVRGDWKREWPAAFVRPVLDWEYDHSIATRRVA